MARLAVPLEAPIHRPGRPHDERWTPRGIVLVDVRPFGLTGRQAEAAVPSAGATLNRNVIPYDTNGSWYTSGLRIGTPAVTTLGMGTAEMREIAAIVGGVLRATAPTKTASRTGRLAGKPSLGQLHPRRGGALRGGGPGARPAGAIPAVPGDRAVAADY